MAETMVPQPESLPEKPEATPPRAGRPSIWRSKGIPVIAIAGAALLIVALILLLAFRSTLFPSRPAGMELEITRVSLSPLTPPPAPIVEIGDTQLTLPLPSNLEIEGQSFPVRATGPGEGTAIDPSAYAGSAIWFYGTVINYVLGLEATEENQALVGQLEPGDPIRLRLSNGTRILFRVAHRQEVSPDDPALFDQSRPALTLVLLKVGEEKREAVFADFDMVEELPPSASGVSASPGQPVQIGDAQVTVMDGHAEVAEDLPSGTIVFLVEFTIQNTGQAALDTRALVMELTDGAGNRYLPTPSYADLGEYGPLTGDVPAGMGVSGTAAYIVPEELAGPAFTWTFGLHSDSELRARFTIPYNPPTSPITQPEVDILEAFLGEGGEVLHVVAEIYNPGEVPLTVSADDISLSSSAGPGEMILAAPPLPWTIEAYDAREVELEFARPEAAAAVLTILGYTFEISGFP